MGCTDRHKLGFCGSPDIYITLDLLIWSTTRFVPEKKYVQTPYLL